MRDENTTLSLNSLERGVSTTTRLDGLSTGGAYLYLKTEIGLFYFLEKRTALTGTLAVTRDSSTSPEPT